MVAAALAVVLSLLQLPQPPKHLSVATSTGTAAAAPGSTVKLYVDVTPNRGIHVYAPGAKDYLPIALKIDSKPGVVVRGLKYPASQTMEFEGEKVPVYGTPFRLVQDVSLARSLKPGTTLTISGALHYQACDDTVCFIPATAPVSWTITVRAPSKSIVDSR